MSEKQTTLTVYQATYDLLRKLGLTTIFGNLGSTEQPFLKNFPADFEYVLGLQEATAVAMADGFAQATGRPALLNLHSSAGTGHGMGNIMTAFQNKTPLIITAGQHTREMILCDPYLTNRDETTLPRPWVKWAYQPVRAQDVPGAIMRAYAAALQPPAGPVYLSIPLSDWNHERSLRCSCRHRWGQSVVRRGACVGRAGQRSPGNFLPNGASVSGKGHTCNSERGGQPSDCPRSIHCVR